jgi:SAM-dependent methyltransferase
MRWIPPAWVVRPAMRFRNRLGRAHATMIPPPLLIMERMNGMVESKMLSLFAELGIPDLIGDGARSAADLATEAKVDADALERLLAFLVSRGLLALAPGGRYRNNAVTEVLRSDHPESMREWARFFASDWHWKMWNHAGHSLATGGGAAEEAFGAPFFDYLTKRNPKAGAAFNRALQGTSRIAGPIVAKGYDFSGIARLCDVGSGTGGMLAAVLDAYPRVRGVLYDLPEVIEQAREPLTKRGLAGRVELAGGSFFDRVPEGCDAYMMQSIIHDWDDEECVTILSNCAKAMAPGGRVLVIENVLGPEPGPADQFARSFDLVMLVTSGSGRERTMAQFSPLFERAGLRLRRDVTLPSLFHVLELEVAR